MFPWWDKCFFSRFPGEGDLGQLSNHWWECSFKYLYIYTYIFKIVSIWRPELIESICIISHWFLQVNWAPRLKGRLTGLLSLKKPAKNQGRRFRLAPLTKCPAHREWDPQKQNIPLNTLYTTSFSFNSQGGMFHLRHSWWNAALGFGMFLHLDFFLAVFGASLIPAVVSKLGCFFPESGHIQLQLRHQRLWEGLTIAGDLALGDKCRVRGWLAAHLLQLVGLGRTWWLRGDYIYLYRDIFYNELTGNVT